MYQQMSRFNLAVNRTSAVKLSMLIMLVRKNEQNLTFPKDSGVKKKL